MARLFLTRRFLKNFEKLDAKAQERIKEALRFIKEDPSVGKRLTGDLSGQYSYRVGDYRIIYAAESDIVWLETVGHRREVYRRNR